jgi:hypothetical protein
MRQPQSWWRASSARRVQHEGQPAMQCWCLRGGAYGPGCNAIGGMLGEVGCLHPPARMQLRQQLLAGVLTAVAGKPAL